ncbi:MAG: hypothetical protein K0R51_2383 [Cytophagaceae bacterium]|jgi:hypothetical protein|nr:hypothetical protein [Cytophagaceae bacterium]
MKKRVALYFTLSCMLSHLCQARVGLAEIFFTTPGGHIICHCDPYSDEQTPAMIGWDQLQQLEKWYFYRDAVVGKGKGYYFIFIEDIKNLKIYKDEARWQSGIDQFHVRPFYTRWLDLYDSPDDFLFMLYMTSFVWAPVLLLILVTVALLTFKKQIRWNKKGILITFSCVLLFLIFIYLKFNLKSF